MLIGNKQYTHFYVEGTPSNKTITIMMGTVEDGVFTHISNKGFKTIVTKPKWIYPITDSILQTLIQRGQV